jgi:hypothetical protein
MRNGLIAWQWSLYPDGHRTRANLVIHVLTVPVFMMGCVGVVLSPLQWRAGLLGLLGILAALAAQGRGHRGEPTSPVPFEGLEDVVSRFLCEQWITWPRFVLSGGLARAWRAAAAQG